MQTFLIIQPDECTICLNQSFLSSEILFNMVQLVDGMIFELASRLVKWTALCSYHVMNQDEWCLTCLVVPELQQSALKKKEQFYYLIILPQGSIFIFFSESSARQVSLMVYLPVQNLGCLDKSAELYKRTVKKLCAI